MMNPATNALQSFILRLKGGHAAAPRADFRDIACGWHGGHPPAGADPLVVLAIHPDWMFLITPVLLGTLVVVGTAVLFNNLRPGLAYPKYWRG